MSTDLKYLAFTAILTASLWIPYVVAQVTTNGALKPPNYLDPTQRPLPLWGKRADRAYINAVENFAPFAALCEGEGPAATPWLFVLAFPKKVHDWNSDSAAPDLL